LLFSYYIHYLLRERKFHPYDTRESQLLDSILNPVYMEPNLNLIRNPITTKRRSKMTTILVTELAIMETKLIQ